MIGTLFNWLLFGVFSVQVYIYSRTFGNDKLWMKLLVYTVSLIELVQTIMNGYDTYQWFVKGFGDVGGLARTFLSPVDIPLFAGVTSLLVQLFFCYRIYKINSSYIIAVVPIGLISLAQAICAIYGAVANLRLTTHVFQVAQTEKRIVFVWLIGTSVADVSIAVIMTILLLRSRRQEHRFSSGILEKIVRMTIETNTITAAAAIICLGVYSGVSSAAYFYAPSAIVGKLYSNTLLATFNNRIALRQTATRMPSSKDRSNRPSFPIATPARDPRIYTTSTNSDEISDSFTKLSSFPGSTSKTYSMASPAEHTFPVSALAVRYQVTSESHDV